MAKDDPDVLLDFQIAANRVYREGPYARAIDYRAEVEPPLADEAEARWIDGRLRGAGWRR